MANYTFTPARRAALRKATAASAAARRGRKTRNTRRIYGQTKNRPSGVKGFKKNTIPYARANQRSQTVGFNSGTIIPGTKKRIVVGAYARLESTTRSTATKRAINKATYKYAKKGTARGAVAGYLKNNVSASAPHIRAKVGGAEARLGTSRGAGPTVIIRRGSHPAPLAKSRAGQRQYDKTIRKKKSSSKSRKERRGSK